VSKVPKVRKKAGIINIQSPILGIFLAYRQAGVHFPPSKPAGK
jgi:frataxin-like iron-binding protein CyaY